MLRKATEGVNSVVVGELYLSGLLVALGQYIVGIFCKTTVEFTDDLSLLEVNLVRVVEDVGAAATSSSDCA